MKKSILFTALALAAVLLFTPALSAGKHDDLQAIKKAVKDNPAYSEGQEVKWFKILIHDTRTNKDRVKITLPIALVELVINCKKGSEWRVDCDEFDIDVKDLFRQLKELGPMTMIEVYEDGEIIKVWLE